MFDWNNRITRVRYQTDHHTKAIKRITIAFHLKLPKIKSVANSWQNQRYCGHNIV